MKKILPLLFCLLLLNSCGIENKKTVLTDTFSGMITFKIDEIEYKGELIITDCNNMSVKFVYPEGVKNTLISYNEGSIFTQVEGQSFGKNHKDSRIDIFFNSMKKMLSMNSECDYLNGMYVFSNSESTLFVNENGDFDRLVCGSQTFYLEKN